METLILYSALALCGLILLCLYRALYGPTVFDRIIGAGFVGTKTAILLLLIGFIYNRIDMFVDLALVYSILNFIGTIIVSKYFIKKGSGIE
ncbi:MAG: monovalent cation/H+ antiporter complex subunit F [Syntrophorhabdaceae bacterium]|nr:monovalent cation/H+ antiporter complex subunit F [Syntrophorhabdaceae bacterium]